MQSRRVVLEAPAGRGKPTTLTQIADRCTAQDLAFVVDLPSWTQTGQDILEFIAGMRPFKVRSIDAAKLAKLYEAQHFIFLLNGWNEVAESDSHRAQVALGSLERQYPEAGILVSTRTHRVKPPLQELLFVRACGFSLRNNERTTSPQGWASRQNRSCGESIQSRRWMI